MIQKPSYFSGLAESSGALSHRLHVLAGRRAAHWQLTHNFRSGAIDSDHSVFR